MKHNIHPYCNSKIIIYTNGSTYLPNIPFLSKTSNEGNRPNKGLEKTSERPITHSKIKKEDKSLEIQLNLVSKLPKNTFNHFYEERLNDISRRSANNNKKPNTEKKERLPLVGQKKSFLKEHVKKAQKSFNNVFIED